MLFPDPKHKVTEYIGHGKQYIRNCDMHVWDQVRSYSPALSFRLLPSPTVQLIQLSRFQQWSLWNPSNKNLPHQHWNKPNLSETSEMTWTLPWIAVSWKVHPGRLTWNIIMEAWKIIFLSKLVICRFHVNLRGCITTFHKLEVSDHPFSQSKSDQHFAQKESESGMLWIGLKDQGNFVSFGWTFQGIYLLCQCGETSNILYVHLGIYDPLWRASYSNGLVQPTSRKDFFELKGCVIFLIELLWCNDPTFLELVLGLLISLFW